MFMRPSDYLTLTHAELVEQYAAALAQLEDVLNDLAITEAAAHEARTHAFLAASGKTETLRRKEADAHAMTFSTDVMKFTATKDILYQRLKFILILMEVKNAAPKGYVPENGQQQYSQTH